MCIERSMMKRCGLARCARGCVQECPVLIGHVDLISDMRRDLIGDEFLFQECAQINVETLTRHKAKKIMTPCPHCYNTLRNEYPQFGGHYEVRHHSTLLAELVEAGRLSNGSSTGEPITLHDPCYLARVNGEVDATRAVIGAANDAQYREMPRCGKKNLLLRCRRRSDVVRRDAQPTRLAFCVRRKRSRPERAASPRPARFV
jgi:heterodisulfide reductase subunit D